MNKEWGDSRRKSLVGSDWLGSRSAWWNQSLINSIQSYRLINQIVLYLNEECTGKYWLKIGSGALRTTGSPFNKTMLKHTVRMAPQLRTSLFQDITSTLLRFECYGFYVDLKTFQQLCELCWCIVIGSRVLHQNHLDTFAVFISFVENA